MAIMSLRPLRLVTLIKFFLLTIIPAIMLFSCPFPGNDGLSQDDGQEPDTSTPETDTPEDPNPETTVENPYYGNWQMMEGGPGNYYFIAHEKIFAIQETTIIWTWDIDGISDSGITASNTSSLLAFDVEDTITGKVSIDGERSTRLLKHPVVGSTVSGKIGTLSSARPISTSISALGNIQIVLHSMVDPDAAISTTTTSSGQFTVNDSTPGALYQVEVPGISNENPPIINPAEPSQNIGNITFAEEGFWWKVTRETSAWNELYASQDGTIKLWFKNSENNNGLLISDYELVLPATLRVLDTGDPQSNTILNNQVFITMEADSHLDGFRKESILVRFLDDQGRAWEDTVEIPVYNDFIQIRQSTDLQVSFYFLRNGVFTGQYWAEASQTGVKDADDSIILQASANPFNPYAGVYAINLLQGDIRFSQTTAIEASMIADGNSFTAGTNTGSLANPIPVWDNQVYVNSLASAEVHYYLVKMSTIENVAQVTFQKNAEDFSRCTIGWAAVTGAEKYYVYCQKDTTWKLLTPGGVTSTSIAFNAADYSDIDNFQGAYFSVTAYDQSRGYSEFQTDNFSNGVAAE